MLNSHATTRYAYHFVSEALIIFMVLMPWFHHSLMWVPYWSYLVVILVACFIFSLITIYTNNYIVYVLMAPILFGVFFLLDYPMLYSIVLSGLLVWRYINIRKEDIISRESSYILLTLLLMVVVGMLVPDVRAMLFPFLVILLNVIGYLWSHLAALSKTERKQVDKKLIPAFVGILIAGALLIYLTYDLFSWMMTNQFYGVISLIGGTLSWFANLLQFIEMPERGWPDQENQTEAGDGYWNKIENNSLVEQITPYLAIAAVITLVLFAIVLLVLFWRKRFKKPLSVEEADSSVSYSALDSHSDMDSGRTSRFNRWLNKPKHPIRKLVYQFERKAHKNKKGRRKYETIEEWFNRIDVNADLEIYQKVRYGEMEQVSESDVTKLRSAIKEADLQFDVNQ
ncbi:hypothetical protein [Oceanobacillus jordanicus]|uniref:DUF4129 domain-containing protein n=1 Tax=Oceanobacillus jordanicus TaxID=2867266 RepID=A0AAW5B603_9BACI|nr:hypothetical protein [Oceanobacillus jordanicus]MCG3419677.1 hypothetical protein [Oceanobacillus jordanicus]